MAQNNESSLSPGDIGMINPLVSQLSIDPFVAMDTVFADVLANGHVVIRRRFPFPTFYIYIVPCVVIHVGC